MCYSVTKIVFYYGPKKTFIRHLPKKIPMTTLSELAIFSDKKMREHVFKIQSKHSDLPKNDDFEKQHIPCLVAFSDQYAAVSDSAIQAFLSFTGQFELDSIYLQNPPMQLVNQLSTLYKKVRVISHKYNTVDEASLREINENYSKNIFGQEKALHQILLSLYPLTRPDYEKPVVMLLYGPTGVGKSETAKYLSKVMKQKLFRRQLSMFHSGEFASYMFGGRHTQAAFSKDLMERESNIILLDEFDKPNPLFHSAFYQIFDEGIYEDKNYHADARRSVIICTSNYSSPEEAREHLGAPLFSRFDAVIKFDPLSEDTIRKIARTEYRRMAATLSENEAARIASANIEQKILNGPAQLENSREIKRYVRDMIADTLLETLLK